MRLARSAAALLLLLVVVAALLHRRPSTVVSLLSTRAPVTLVLVEKLTLPELRALPGLTSGDPVGVMPARAGGAGWDLVDTLTTGSRSPLAPDSPRMAAVRVPGASEADTWLRRGGVVVLVSLSAGGSRFVPVCLHGTGQGGLLTSPSTGFRPGLVAATDVARTVASLRGETGAAYGAGRPMVVLTGSAPPLVSLLTDLEAQASALRYLVALPWVLSGLLLLAAWRKEPRVALFCAAYPVGLLAAPLVTSGSATYGVALVLALAVAVVRLPVAGLFRALAAAVLVLLTLDTLLSLGLLYRAPLSFSAAEAARFYGIGNETGGLVIGAALVAASGDLVLLPLLGLAAALLLGAPVLGANAGCFLAMLVAMGGALVGRAPARRRLPLALLALVLLLAGGTGIALWDRARGRERSHIGEAVGASRETVTTLIARKLAMNAHLTTTSPWALLFFLQLALLARQKRGRGAGEVALGAVAVWLLNDAGIVAGATCLLFSATPPADPPRLQAVQYPP